MRASPARAAVVCALAVFAVAVSAIAVGGCATVRPTPVPAGAPATDDPGRTRVPVLLGLPVATAAKLLGDAGLAAQVSYVTDPGVPAGAVLGSDPAGGARVAVATVVLVRVAQPGPPDSLTLAELAQRHPEAFVGAFTADRTTVVALNPGVDPTQWRSALDAAAAGTPYRVVTCPRSWAELARVQVLLSRHDWTRRADLRFAVVMDAATCSVRLSSANLDAADIDTLTTRYGPAVTIDRVEAARG